MFQARPALSSKNVEYRETGNRTTAADPQSMTGNIRKIKHMLEATETLSLLLMKLIKLIHSFKKC